MSVSRFFRFVATEFWGSMVISNSTAEHLPSNFLKVVKIIIISFNAFAVKDGAPNRCIPLAQMSIFVQKFRTLFLTMGVELRVSENKRLRRSNASSSSGSSCRPSSFSRENSPVV